LIGGEAIAFTSHFYGKFPEEILQYSSRQIAKWHSEAVKLHNKLNKSEDG